MAKYVLELHTEDAKYVYDYKTSSDKTLFDFSLVKIAHLYNLAKKRNVFAYIELYKIESLLHEITDSFSKYVSDYSRMVQDKKSNVEVKILSPVLVQRVIDFSNQLIFGLSHLFTIYDKLNEQLMLARDLNAMKDKYTFFNLNTKNKKRIFAALTNIVNTPCKDLPDVSISQYLEQTEDYKQAIQLYGDIDPKALHEALTLNCTPPMKPEEFNKVKARLEVMKRKR